jgi:hypothetical protein
MGRAQRAGAMASRRAAAQPGPKKGRRWDRRQALIAIVAVLIVAVFIGSAMISLFYR